MRADEIRARLRELQAMDLPAHGGRTLAYVYDSGLAEADALGLEALAMFAGSNGLDPTAFRCSRWRTTSCRWPVAFSTRLRVSWGR
jgi:glutamate/tyrosine decarboxylase-like PLP-dependent enzyme